MQVRVVGAVPLKVFLVVGMLALSLGLAHVAIALRAYAQTRMNAEIEVPRSRLIWFYTRACRYDWGRSAERAYSKGIGYTIGLGCALSFIGGFLIWLCVWVR